MSENRPHSFSSPDPRLALVLALFMGMILWSAPALAVFVYLCGISAIFIRYGLHRRAAPGTLRRTVWFVLFWPTVKFVLTGAVLVWEVRALWGWDILAAVNEGAATHELLRHFGVGMYRIATDSLLLAMRLGALMGVGLSLALSVSPHAMGKGFAWLLGPVFRLFRKEAWETALALTLMVQFLPRIHTILHTLRTAAKARGLPSTGWRYYRLALPGLLRLLARQPYTQAMAVSVRRLDAPEAWVFREPLPLRGAVACLGLMAGATLLLALPG